MKHAMSIYPIGATWICKDRNGRNGFITLTRREEYFEVWHYGYSWDDGSGYKFDWATSYALAKKNHWVTGKFKRVATANPTTER